MLLVLFVVWIAMAPLMKFRSIKKQKVATGLLLDKLHKQDFAGPLKSRLESPGTDQPLSCC